MPISSLVKLWSKRSSGEGRWHGRAQTQVEEAADALAELVENCFAQFLQLSVSPTSEECTRFSNQLAAYTSELRVGYQEAERTRALSDRVGHGVQRLGAFQRREVEAIAETFTLSAERMVQALQEAADAGGGVGGQLEEMQGELRRMRELRDLKEIRAGIDRQLDRTQKIVERQRDVQRKIRDSYETAVKSLEVRLEQADSAARTDVLTGLPNRAALEEYGEEIMVKVRESQAPFSLCLLDLDGFKGINDTYGHAAGDEALVFFAKHLRAMAGDPAFVARLGGDEFVVLSPGTARALGWRMANLGAELAKAPLEVSGNEHEGTVTLGLSYGVVHLQSHETLSEGMRRADESMLTMKGTHSNPRRAA